MTTLPQNPPFRTTRPTGMQGPPPSMPPGGPAGGLTGADILRVLRGNAWLILIFVGVSAVAGYFVNGYLAKNYSRYTATGYCEISTPSTISILGRPVATSDNSAMNIEQRTQVQSMRSESLFSKVLQSQTSPIRQTQWFLSFNGDTRLARQDLVKNFSVNAIAETRLISASMQYSIPEDAKTIVQEIIDEHLRNQATLALNKLFEKSQQLNALKLRTEADLRSVTQDRQELGTQLARLGVTPGGLNVSPKASEIQATVTALSEAQELKGKAQAAVDQFNQALQSGNEPPMLVRMVDSDPDIQKTTGQLREIELTLSTLPGTSANPTVKRYNDQREALEKHLKEARDAAMTRIKATYPEELKSQLAAYTANVASLTTRLDQQKAEAGEIGNLLNRFAALESREQYIQSTLREINEGIDQGNVSSASNGTTISWAIKPITPEIPSFPKLSITLSTAIAIGLALALAIAFARELLDTTIRSPRDVAKIGSIAVLGQISHEDDDPQAAGARLPFVIAEAPQSMTAEQLRQFRTKLQHSASLDTTRSLMVTSPNPGDGKTTVVVNLAAGLALVGRRILLVDANVRRPELHRLFNIENNQGFTTVLSSLDQLPNLAKPTKIPNLSVLTSGPKVGNTTELLESTLLHDFIEKAMESYDHVIFDSGPILFASETVALAPRVDGVVTVVRARQSTRGVLGRARETLRQIKAENLGVVINGVRAYGGGYYGRNIKTYYQYANNT